MVEKEIIEFFSLFGIYDGHGGAVCADFLRDYLH